MADRFPGGVISKTPPVIVAPVDGEGGSASGVWTLEEQLGLQKAGSWPQGVLPRELYTWGYNGLGALGDSTTVDKSSPVQIGALTNWSQVAAKNHTLAITTSGELYSWGFNANGQLGHNNTVPRSSPVQVGALTNWAQVAAGNRHTASVTTDGELYAWGSNGNGRLGDGTTIFRSSPVQVGNLTNWAQVSAGYAHNAAVTTGGNLYCWGGNTYGQLGHGAGDPRSSPVQIGSLTNWSQVAAGNNHTASVKTDGTLWTWGSNVTGVLGLNIAPANNKSSPTQVGTLTDWAQVSVGTGFCQAIKTDGTLWAWGSNNTGQLGNGTSFPSKSSPVQIGALTNWARVEAGTNHTASVTTDGELYAWGSNGNGRLGDGTVVNKSSPVQVGALTSWTQVAVGSYHTTAITRG